MPASPAGAQSFDEVRRAVDGTVRKVFPKARAFEDFGMKGWKVARPKGAPRPTGGGTLSPDHVLIFLADRTAGPTLHVWYPGDYYLLEHHKTALKKAGFTVMRGCLPFTKKRPYPIGEVEGLLREIKRLDAR